MAKILFTDKVKIKDIPVAEINKFTDANANEIKTVVNGLDDSVIGNTAEIEVLKNSVNQEVNELIEKGFNHVINFDWFVFAQVYRFNGVLTDNLVTDTITLDIAPTTTDYKRFDVIVFNDDFTFSVVKGAEGLNPAIPKINILTQIQLTVILVEANTTAPSYVTKQTMYDEGVGLPTEFTVTKVGTGITINSTEQSSSGTNSIKVVNPNTSYVVFLDKGTTYNSLDIDTVTFKIKNINAGNWRFYLYSYNSIDSFYQGTALIRNGRYGYNSYNITDWQTIIVPISAILGTGEVHNTGFALTFASATATFYFDEFALNGNFTQAPSLINPLTYLELTDTPSTYSGQAGKVATVNATETGLEFDTPIGTGDMLKSVYDPTNINSDAFATDNFKNATVAKTTPIDADNLTLWDSVSSSFKKLTWANVKATLKTYFDTLYATVSMAKTEYMLYACSDETTDLTLGDKISIRMPYAMTLTEVRISLNEAPTITKFIADVKEGGVSIFSTLPSIDTTELTSVTASVPAVISDTSLADNALLVVSITQLGSGAIGKGFKILFIGQRA